MISTTPRITGTSLPETAFRMAESDKTIEVAQVFEVLNGNLAGYRVRGFVPPDACRAIVSNFWMSTNRVARVGVGEDGVEAYLIGASHYGKPSLQYLEEARACAPAVESLFAGTVNPVRLFKNVLASGGTDLNGLRPAQLNGLNAGESKAVYWNNYGSFLLEPHDDLAQVRDPIQSDFEIQQTTRVMALNIYAEVPDNSGQVQVWNIEPDDQTRAELDVSYVGFPYPAELLREYPTMVVGVETGDLCVFNGNLIHAVRRGSAASPKSRLLLTCFMGLNLKRELIWWT